MDIDLQTLGIGLLGGGGFAAAAMRLISVASATSRAVAQNSLGNEFEKNLFARLKEVEDREQKHQEKVIRLTEDVGRLTASNAALKAELAATKADLEDAKKGYKRVKELLQKVTDEHDRIKEQNTQLLAKLGVVRPTGHEGRPFLKGGQP